MPNPVLSTRDVPKEYSHVSMTNAVLHEFAATLITQLPNWVPHRLKLWHETPDPVWSADQEKAAQHKLKECVLCAYVTTSAGAGSPPKRSCFTRRMGYV